MAFVATTASFAQWREGSLTIQPKIGLNVANVSDGDGSDNRIGLALSAEFEYRLSPVFSLSAGALYSMQGCKGVVEYDEGNSGELTAKLDYINIPILANVYVAKGLAVKLGVQPGFNRQAQGYGFGKRRNRDSQPTRHKERRLQHPCRNIISV